MMCDMTPAWREIYTRIADELATRYTTFQSAIDWLTMIGADPNVDKYPPEWQILVPEHLRGKYEPPGWTANGIQPWGLQPDPIGSDGFLMFRGFFNLVLGFYKYVSGDDKWEKPFQVTGYLNRIFEWDQHSIVNFMHDDWAERPQGPHCENTKIWPFCLSGAGLGLQLYDELYGARKHWVYERWLEYAKKHYMGFDRKGNLEWVCLYFDPITNVFGNFRDDVAAYGALAVTLYVIVQDRPYGTMLYEMAVDKLGWNNPKKPMLQLHPDPRWVALAMMVARELGDHTTERHLRRIAESTMEPRFFGEDMDRFAWWFHLGEKWPRGQLSTLMVMTELGAPGAWCNVFNKPNLTKFSEPTVSGVDYPTLGICQCWNDLDDAALWVETYCGSAARRGEPTRWKVTGLPDTSKVHITMDGSEFPNWAVTGPDSIEIRSDIGPHRFRIATGFRGQPAGRHDGGSVMTGSISSSPSIIAATPGALAAATRSLKAGGGCSCC